MVTREWRSNCRFSVWAHTRGGRGMQLSGFNNCSLLLYKLDEWFRLSHSLLLQNIHCASSKWIHSIVKPPASRYWQNLKRKLWEELYEHVSDWLSNWYHVYLKRFWCLMTFLFFSRLLSLPMVIYKLWEIFAQNITF